MSLPLASRILASLSLALLLASLIGHYYGARTIDEITGSVYQGDYAAVVVGVASVASDGSLAVYLTNIDSAYAIKVRGSPLVMLQQLSTLNITLVDERVLHRVRSGIVVMDAKVDTSPLVINLLSLASGVTPIQEISGGNSSARFELRTGEGIAFIIVSKEGGPVTYKIVFEASDYEKLGLGDSIMIALVLGASSMAIWIASRRPGMKLSSRGAAGI